jgi:hypothetical protein
MALVEASTLAVPTRKKRPVFSFTLTLGSLVQRQLG